MSDTFTHKSLAELCEVSETTIKSYRRKFPGFIPVATRGKPIRFRREAGDVCLRIRDCFNKGMSVGETHKVLKEHFKEYGGANGGRPAPPRPAGGVGVFSPEYMEKFFHTAGQMMQGMASLATAQAKADRRLQKLETAIERLMEIETANREHFSEILVSLAQAPAAAPTSPQGTASEPPEPETARQPRRKVVTVRGKEGEVKSYSFDSAEKAECRDGEDCPERPSDAFLGTPVVIHNDKGEFLGVPGRLPLKGFVEIIEKRSHEAGVSTFWSRRDKAWVYTLDAPDGDCHELHFSSTTTPRGNLVVLFSKVDVNGEPTSQAFLQAFFKQVKDGA